MLRRAVAAAALTCLGVACAGPVAPASGPLDFESLADRQMVLAVTTDPEGEPRTTRLWIAVVDGAGYLRSLDTPWSKDVAREPEFRLRVDDVSFPVRATQVPPATDEHARVMAAFAEKYGWLSRTVLGAYWLIGRYSGPTDARILRLEALPPADAG